MTRGQKRADHVWGEARGPRAIDPAAGPDSLSVLILTYNEGGNIASVLRAVRKTLAATDHPYEMLVIDGGSTDDTVEAARAEGARVVLQSSKGYANALREGFSLCTGDYVVALDADQSHDPKLLLDLLAHRREADLVIASRYIPFGHAVMPATRRALSYVLNRVFAFVLDLPIKDMSSGFRLYSRRMLEELTLEGRFFDILPEIAVKAYVRGYRVREIPFHYQPRKEGQSNARVFKFGLAYLRTLGRCHAVRNSAESADYDYHAFHSRHPIRRYWHRRRYAIVTGFAGEYTAGVDVGCGSSVILNALPNVVGVDISHRKLRFLKGHMRREVLRADLRRLPFPDRAFDLFIGSRVIESVEDDPRVFEEMARLVRPGGTLILGTPDHATLVGRAIEWLNERRLSGISDERRVSRYTFDRLAARLDQHGFDLVDHAYVGRGELVVKATRREGR
jgi:dolichol-phosphate mannosyltransferase